MYRVAELLEQKQALIEQKAKQASLEGIAEIERALHHIDFELSQWEHYQVDAPSTAPL